MKNSIFFFSLKGKNVVFFFQNSPTGRCLDCGGERKQGTAERAEVNRFAEQVIPQTVWAELAGDTECHAAFQNVRKTLDQVSDLICPFSLLPVQPAAGETNCRPLIWTARERKQGTMKDLVFVESAAVDAVPYTTSEVIAQFAGVQRQAVQKLIQKHESDFTEFGRVVFKIQPLQTKGGIQSVKVYQLNEEQATLLMTYLKNTPTVRAFKKELVHQFYAMRRELTRRAVAREARKPTRREMTDAIRDCVPDSPHKGMMYSNYSKIAYKIALGRSVQQLRREKSVPPHGNLAEFLTVEETEAVKKTEGRIAVLLELGMSYREIQAVLARSVRSASQPF